MGPWRSGSVLCCALISGPDLTRVTSRGIKSLIRLHRKVKGRGSVFYGGRSVDQLGGLQIAGHPGWHFKALKREGGYMCLKALWLVGRGADLEEK